MNPHSITIRLLATLVFTGLASAQDAAPKDPAKKRTDDLAKRLLRGKTDDSDAMSRIVNQMKDVETQLVKQYDTGPKTQRLERRILKELEAAIAAAVRRGQNRSRGSAQGEPRRRPSRKSPQPSSGEQDKKPGPAEDSATGRPQEQSGAARSDIPTAGPLRESRRGWGHLPARDREEVIQGANEVSLERYRAWIERYYRALVDETRE